MDDGRGVLGILIHVMTTRYHYVDAFRNTIGQIILAPLIQEFFNLAAIIVTAS